MSTASYDALTAHDIARGVAAGDFSAREVAEAALAAVDARDSEVGAFLQVTPELALEAADRVDAARAAGEELPALAGVPLAVKDNMNLAGTRTTCASHMLEGYESPYTATCVRRMLDAGAVPVGKANMDEFAFGSTTDTSAFHPTNNPWDLSCVPGGSSGGSAAAIAAYYVIGPAEAFSNLARFDGIRYGYQEPDCASLADQSSLSRAHGFGTEAKRRQMLGAYLLSSGVYDRYYYAAQKARTLITRDYARAFEQVDVIAMPASPTVAFEHGAISDPTQMYLSDMFTISINIAGNGGISVPVGLGRDTGLPVAVQLVAPAFRDERLIAFGSAVERGCAGAWGDAATAGEGAPVAPAFRGKGGELA